MIKRYEIDTRGCDCAYLQEFENKEGEWCKWEDAEKLQDRVGRVLQWVEAYPLEVFPEPDFKKAAKVLKDNGMTLDAISASNFRHVLNKVKEILKDD